MNRLAAQIARRAVDLMDRTGPSGRAAGRQAVRLGIDGPIERDTAELADAVTSHLVAGAVPVARVSTRNYQRARSIRMEYGRDDAAAFYDLWYDLPALSREVLDPLGPGGRGTWLASLRDPDTDRSTRAPVQAAAPGTIAVIDGRFLLRDDVAPGFDLLVHLSLTPAARLRRLPADEVQRVLPAWERYLDDCRPAENADLVVKFDHPDRPAVLRDRNPARSNPA